MFDMDAELGRLPEIGWVGIRRILSVRRTAHIELDHGKLARTEASIGNSRDAFPPYYDMAAPHSQSRRGNEDRSRVVGVPR